jgi:hypothetical protein
MKITYEEIEPYLLDYAQNFNIPEEIDYRIKAYIQKNPDFQKELDELKETADFLKEMPLASPSPQVSIGFYAMLAQEQNKIATLAKPIAQIPPSSPTSRPNTMRKWGAMVGVACLLLVGFGISWQIMNKENNHIAMENSANKKLENKNPTTTPTEETPTEETPTKETQANNDKNHQENETQPQKPAQNNNQDFGKNDPTIVSVERRNKPETKNKEKKLAEESVNYDITPNERIATKKLSLSSPMPNIKNVNTHANTQRRKTNNKIILKQEDAEMQQGAGGSFSTYNNRNTEIAKNEMISEMPSEMDDNASQAIKQLSTSEKLAKINEAQASTGELLQLLENDQNTHIKLWAMQALTQQLKNTPNNQITQKIIALFPTYTNIALQMATLDWIAQYNPANKKSIIDTLLKNDKIAPIVKKQAEKLKK